MTSEHLGSHEAQLFLDRPIISREQDRLHRRAFADALARTISGWNGQDSLVIGLYGPWGSGKSSLKYMILESLGDKWPVLEFNPWQFANREKLPEAFFRDVGAKIGTSVFRSEDDRKRVIAKWEKYRAYLQVGASLLDVVRGPIATALIAVPLVQIGLSILGTTWSLGFGILIALAGAALKASPQLADRITDAIRQRKTQA